MLVMGTAAGSQHLQEMGISPGGSMIRRTHGNFFPAAEEVPGPAALPGARRLAGVCRQACVVL